jgi:hypothetical protein
MRIQLKIPSAKKLQDALKKYPEAASREMAKAIRDATLLLEGNVAKEAPVKTGNLRGRISHRISPTRGEVFTTVKYAQAVHEGTRPHIIRPRRAKALRFRGGDGKFIFAKSVNHPGTKGNPFFTRATEKTLPKIREFFRAALRRAVQKI